MGFKGKVKIESRGILATFIFYLASGLACLAALAIDFRLIHMALIGVFSLISAFTLVMKRTLALWFIAPLFFTATTFAALMLYYTVGKDILLSSAMAAYLVLTWIFTAYAVAKRKKV